MESTLRQDFRLHVSPHTTTVVKSGGTTFSLSEAEDVIESMHRLCWVRGGLKEYKYSMWPRNVE